MFFFPMLKRYVAYERKFLGGSLELTPKFERKERFYEPLLVFFDLLYSVRCEVM